jgi:hypothetical protein
MPTTYSKFDSTTGEILFTAATDDDFIVHLPGENIAPQTHYIVNGRPALRPTIDVADMEIEVGSKVHHATGPVPAGCRLTVNGQDLGEMPQHGATFTPDAPGVFRFEIFPPWPYRPAIMTIVVREPAPPPIAEPLAPGVLLALEPPAKETPKRKGKSTNAHRARGRGRGDAQSRQS